MGGKTRRKCPSCGSRAFCGYYYGETTHGKYKQLKCTRCGYIGTRNYNYRR